jgi:hypothetical protein
MLPRNQSQQGYNDKTVLALVAAGVGRALVPALLDTTMLNPSDLFAATASGRRQRRG